MSYISKSINGFDTRNNFIRSMDIATVGTNADAALQNYEKAWFSSTRKEYLTQAFKLVLDKSKFWPKRVIPEMLDEIFVDYEGENEKAMAQDIDLLKSKFMIWSTKRKNQPVTADDLLKDIKSFEKKYKYTCPESFKFYWMNNGAYITLRYGIQYEGLLFPGYTQKESLSKLEGIALQVLEEHDHNVDDRLFKMCHFLYSMYGNI